MRWLFFACSLAIGSGVLLGQPMGVPPAGIRKNVLTNQGVALLAQAGYSEGFIIDMIYHKQTQFDVSAEGLAWLAKQTLSERIVRTMVVNERKEEQTAILSAVVSVPQPLPPSSSPRVVAGTVNLAMPVRMPTATPVSASIDLKGWEPDRWYVVPNIPSLAAPGSR